MNESFRRTITEALADVIRRFDMEIAFPFDSDGDLIVFNESAILYLLDERGSLDIRLIVIHREKCEVIHLGQAMANRARHTDPARLGGKRHAVHTLTEQADAVAQELLTKWSDLLTGDDRWLVEYGYQGIEWKGDFCAWVVEQTKHRHKAKK